MTVLVWSEKPDPDGVTDCTYSSGLMGLVFAGKTDYEHGIYTSAERDALERSDTQPDHTGASLDDVCYAIKSRYGLTVTKSAPAALPGLLKRTGIALAVQGINGNVSPTSHVRRWQPAYTGGHCVCVIPLGDGNVWWLDPLAPNKWTGEQMLASTVIAWAEGSGASVVFTADEFAPKLYTQAEMDKVLDQLAKAQADLAACRTALAAANARIDAAKAALGG
jgi:hypothetical protein